jgi:hypothetical protein
LAASSPGAGLAVIVGGAVCSLVCLGLWAVVLPRRTVGDAERTARMLSTQVPELNLDLLSVVELSRALKTEQDFSPELARAFLREVDARASAWSARRLVDPKPTQRAAVGLVLSVVVMLALLAWKGPTIRAGLVLAFMPSEAAEPIRRQPITGEIELTYRYPAHTGLEARTLPSTTGDVSAPVGTEVTLKTRADRDVDSAALVMGAQGIRVPLAVAGKRELSGSFVVDQSGQFHLAFLDGSKLVAEGPEQSITAEVDQPPQPRIISPLDGLELNAKNQNVTVKFDASDDYGLTALDLVFTPDGAPARRISLKPDEGRITRGSYAWDLGPLMLKPGQGVAYFLEAIDNDAVKGPKKASSSVLRLKLYSAAEHRREALAKAQVLWGRLVDHLADRMEAADRASPTSVDAAVAGKPIDERGTQLASEFKSLVQAIEEDSEPPLDVVAALLNVGNELQKDVSQVATNRQFLLRLAGRIASSPGKPKFIDSRNTFTQDVQRRVAASIATDIAHSEKNVLYLEGLLDRAKLDAIAELAKQLREDRKDLTRLLDDYSRTKDSLTQQALMEQMRALKQRMLELQQRMAEMSKGIRDDFMNAEALRQMQEDFKLESSLDEVEQLVKEGKAEEALKKMQELAMEMDDFLEKLDEAGAKSEQETDPELAAQFQEFQNNLDDAAAKQEKLADQTRSIRDKYRAQQKERIAKQGEALKRELKDKLEELEKSWKQLDATRFGFRFEDMQKDALQARENVQQSLQANDFDLASEAADRMEDRAQQMAAQAAEQRRLEEQFQNPPEMRRESRQSAERLAKDAKKASEVAQKIRDLFPQGGQQMSDGDRQKMSELSKEQRSLQQQAQQLQQQMDAIGERAPIFNEEAKQQMEQAGQRMQGAGEKLAGKDPGRGFGEQQGAMQALKGIQQALQQAGNSGRKGGIPLPMKGMGRGRSPKDQKVEIPDEDPNAAPREFRKDVMDAMKQGAPERYKEQNKKYYEELVK